MRHGRWVVLHLAEVALPRAAPDERRREGTKNVLTHRRRSAEAIADRRRVRELLRPMHELMAALR